MFDMVGEKLIDIVDAVFMWMFESLIAPFADLRLITTLIFGRDEELSTVWGTFRPDELALALGPVYYTVMTLAGVVLLALVAVNGARISGAGRNPQTRNVLTDFLKDLLFVAIILFNLPLIYDLLFAVNMSIVNLFSSAYDTESITKISNSPEDLNGATDTPLGTLGTILIFLVLIGLTLWANFYYLMRKVTLVILMGLGPLMIVMWLLPQFKSLTGAWFKELVSSIFIQAIHAFVFFTIATLSSADKSLLGTVMIYVLFIPITESLRRLLSVGGDMQGNLSKAGAMMGMAGLAGLAGSVKGAMDGKSVMGSLQDAYKGANGAAKGKGGAAGGEAGEGADSIKNTLGANAGSDTGSDTKAEKMLRTGDIFSKGGKAVMGMAGSVAGMGLGPVGAMAGATAGFTVGGAVGGVTGRAGAALAQGIGSRLAKGKEAASDITKGGANEFADAVADTETAQWAKENKDTIMSDLKERFPNATPADLEKKFAGIQNEKRAGFYQGAQANFKAANANAKNDALGKDLASSSAVALANKWGDDNQKDFFDQYDKDQPQRPGESQGSYATRRMNAFNDKKADMRDKFQEAGVKALGTKGLDEPMSKEDFLNKLAPEASRIAGVPHQEGYTSAIKGAVEGTQNRTGKALGKDLAATSATALANKWEEDNQKNFFSQYDKDQPKQEGESAGAYEARRMSAFTGKKAEMQNKFHEEGIKALGANGGDVPMSKESFINKLSPAASKLAGVTNQEGYSNAIKGAVGNVQDVGGKATGKDFATSSANALTDNWAKQNQDSFMSNFEKQNPQQANESNSDYQSRKSNAFTAKKQNMQKAFQGAAVQAAGGEGALDSTIEPAQFEKNLSSNIQKIDGVANGYQASMTKAVENLSGMQLDSKKGQPNIPYLASGMANVAVKQQKNAYVADQIAQGVTPTSAGKDWDANHAMPAYQKALGTYNDSLNNMSDVKTLNQPTGSLANVGQSVARKISQGVAFTGAATGVTGFAQGVSNFRDATTNGVSAIGSNMALSTYGQEGNKLVNAVKAVGPSLKAGHVEAVQTLADANGGAVNAQSNFTNNAGYGAAVIGGVGGYRAGKRIASKISPYNSAVQETISSPSEVMQMAQTTTDDRGIRQIAPGAVRQVITPDESYIEVKTNSGENRVVSRKGAGHPGLGKGETVYQDLQMQDDTLVVSKPKGSQSSSYRLDSGGGRIPSNVAVEQNPNSLLGTGQSSTFGSPSRHTPIQKQNAPLFNQNVDSGNFYVEDLQQANMSNVQVVVEKDRQFMTAQKDGTTYRVSPVYAGDSRLGTNETRTIPMTVKNNSLKPNISAPSEIAVQSNVNGSTSPEDYYTSNSLGGMVVSREFEDMMPNKQTERVRRTQARRAELDAVRRKQGILG